MPPVASSSSHKKTPIQLADATLRDLKDRHIQPTPENYTVWFHHLSGRFPKLTKTLTEQLESNPQFGDADATALFEQFFSIEEHNQAINAITEQLIEELKGVLENLSGTYEISGDYGLSLNALSEALANDGNPSHLQPTITAVAKATQKMAAENKSLGSQLTSSSLEISQLKSDLEDMRRQAMTDGLTGIANRKCFDQELEAALQFAQEDNSPVSLLMVDIDHFKVFNDTYGHQMGDQVLKLLADILKDSVKGQDLPARYGGEEFSIILPETKLAGAVGLAEALRNRVVRRKLINKMTGDTLGNITLSIGATQYQPKETSEEFVARADKALYGAKNAGRDQVATA